MMKRFMENKKMENENAKLVMAGNAKMMNQLYPEIASPTENLIFSPLSLHTILSLAYQGSSATTEKAFRKALNLPDKQRTALGYESVMSELNNASDVILEIANRIYIKKGYKMASQFVDIATKQFAAGAENIDFTQSDAAQTINDWVAMRTKYKITRLVNQEQFDSLTSMVLVNAVYFKGNWATPFKKKFTICEKFYITETDTVDCDMMHLTTKFAYVDDSGLDAQVIQLPYKNPALSMVIVLPHSKTGLGKLEKKMGNVDLKKRLQSMKYVLVELHLPKFRIDSFIGLTGPLSKIGLGEAFGDSADFSELLESSKELKISTVVQKAFIEVNEEGAEAAAVTGIEFRMKCKGKQKEIKIVLFRAEHPFMFYLIHESEDGIKQMLLCGKLVTLRIYAKKRAVLRCGPKLVKVCVDHSCNFYLMWNDYVIFNGRLYKPTTSKETSFKV